MTYKKAQENYVKKYGRVVRTCWIADILRSNGRATRKAWNSGKGKNQYFCPEDVRPKLENILKELGML